MLQITIQYPSDSSITYVNTNTNLYQHVLEMETMI